MAKKKRRTELDIDPSILTEVEDEAPPTEMDDSAVSVPDTEKEPKTIEEAPPDVVVTKGKINKLKLALVISSGMGVVLLAAAIVWSVLALTAGKAEEPAKAVDKAKPVVAAPEIKAGITPTYEFKPFLVNLGKGEDRRLVRVTFYAQMSDAKVSEEIKRNLVLIRENVYLFLKSKSLDMFRDAEKKKRLAVDIAIVLNRSIQSGAITKVLLFGLVMK